MTIEEIKQLIQVVIESGVAEIEVQRGDNRVRIRKQPLSTDVMVAPAPAYYPAVIPPVAPVAAPAAGAPPAVNSAPPPVAALPAAAPDANLAVVKSPIVGTYYDSPSPDAQPFVRVGDSVQPGQVLCIIESMKLMNEIESEVSGVIVSKLVENSRAVEYGQSLFTIRPH